MYLIVREEKHIGSRYWLITNAETAYETYQDICDYWFEQYEYMPDEPEEDDVFTEVTSDDPSFRMFSHECFTVSIRAIEPDVRGGIE